MLQAPRSKVSQRLQRYQSDGIDSLLEGYRSGRPSELSEKQQQQLGDILDSGPVYNGQAEYWSAPTLRRRSQDRWHRHIYPALKKSPLAALGAPLHRRRRQRTRTHWERFNVSVVFWPPCLVAANRSSS